MKLTPEQVKTIAKLARLSLSEAEVRQFQTELSAILEYIEQLQQVNVYNVPPTHQVTGLTGVTRPDNAQPLADEELKRLRQTLTAEERGYLKVKGIFATDHHGNQL